MKYRITAEVEAETLTEAWSTVASLPSNFTADEGIRARDVGVTRFSVEEISRQISADFKEESSA